jgi:DNA-binding MarR family transcriptional regulator
MAAQPSHGALLRQLSQVARLRHAALRKALAPLQLSPGRWWALRCVARCGSPSLGELAALMHVELRTASSRVVALADAGLVLRHSDAQDGRLVRVTLTVAGMRLMARGVPLLAGIDRCAAGALEAEEAEPVIACLRAMRETMQHGIQ